MCCLIGGLCSYADFTSGWVVMVASVCVVLTFDYLLIVLVI